MTRFWISPRDAVNLICAAAHVDERGVTVIPNPKACDLKFVADCVYETMSGIGPVDTKIVGARPGEKHSEALISFGESTRAVVAGDGNYWLLPPGRSGDGELFELDSDGAEAISAEELREAIALAESI
jgi:hypothetical protein